MRRAWVALVLIAVLATVASAGCGVDTSSDATTDSGVPLPEAPGEKQAAERFFRGYYHELISVGTKPSVARCYEKEVRSLSPAVLRKFAQASASGETLAQYNSRFYKNCVPAGTSAVESSVSDSQLDHTRQLLGKALRPVLASEGASSAQIECVEEGIDSLPPVELRALTGGGQEADAIGKAIFNECGGH